MPQIQNYDKALTRLINILQKLHAGDTLYISELAEEFGVSKRTVQRDLNERLIRFPIEKHGQGWRMMSGFCLEKSKDTKDTLILDILSQVALSVGGDFGERANALLARLKNKNKNPFYSNRILEDISDNPSVLFALQEAISLSLVIGFHYKEKYRTVKPYKIVNFDGFWYLYGEDVIDGKIKTFYLKDIPLIHKSKDSFEMDASIQDRLESAMNAWFEPNSEPFMVRILATKEIAKYFDRRPLSKSQQIITRHKSGDIELEIMASSENEALFEIKRWIPSLIILSPKSLAMKLKDISDGFAKRQVEELIFRG